MTGAYSMRIWLDPERLAAYQLTPQDVENALRRQNVEVPSGRIESQQREFTVLAETDLRTPQQFNDLIIKDANSYLVRLSDVGQAELGALDERRVVRFNGEPAIAVGVIKQATANPLEVSEAVNKILPIITSSLPEGMQVRVAHDKSVFIAESIKNVYATIGEAVVLVILIIFLFLRSVRATLIPLVTIPVSLIGAFALMHWLGFSINTLTLLALVLAIGLVVDDAIVMLENIYRHVEEGMAPVKAALLGSREISFAIIAMTITLAAVYAPIGFMTGPHRPAVHGVRLDFGRRGDRVGLRRADIVADDVLQVAQASNPPQSGLSRHRALSRRGDKGLPRTAQGSPRGAPARPPHRPGGRVLELFPVHHAQERACAGRGRGRINVNFRGPEGATIDFTDAYAKQLEDIALAVPEADRVFVVSGSPTVSQGRVILRVKPWDERERSQQEIGRSIAPQVSGVTGVVAFPGNSPPLGQSSRSKPINFVIQTSQPYSELQKMVDTLLERIQDYPGLVDIESDLKLNSPQLDISVDREKAASMGVEIETLGRTLETMLGGRQVTRFKKEGQQYDVVVKVGRISTGRIRTTCGASMCAAPTAP